MKEFLKTLSALVAAFYIGSGINALNVGQKISKAFEGSAYELLGKNFANYTSGYALVSVGTGITFFALLYTLSLVLEKVIKIEKHFGLDVPKETVVEEPTDPEDDETEDIFN